VTTPAPSGEGSGLICGFRLMAAPSPKDEPERAVVDEPSWLHFNLSDSRARAWIAHCELPDDARELLLDSEPRIHVDVLPAAVAAVLGDLHHDFDHDPERLGTLRLYLDSSLLLSGRTHPLKTADLLRRRLSRGDEALTPLGLFQLLIERLAASCAQVAAELSEEVDSAEDRILAGNYSGERTPLGNLRRLVARLRRMVSANRTALQSLPATLPGLYDAAEHAELRSAIERFEAVGQDLELVQERARLLQEEIAAGVNEKTSRNLFVLSIATTTLLPITLITGIFGMNVRGLPFADSPHGFSVVMLGIFATVLLALSLLRRIGAL
jgi:zinc transporter